MKKTIIFSKNKFYINDENKPANHDTDKNQTSKYVLDKNTKLELSPGTNYKIFDEFDNMSTLNLETLASNKDVGIRYYSLSEMQVVEIVTIQHETPLAKLNCEKAEVLINNKSLYLLYENEYRSFYFDYDKQNFMIDFEDNIYIFNKNCIVTFNKTYHTFTKLKCEKFVHEEDTIEALCPLPKIHDYFLKYTFYLDKNSVKIKKYKQKAINLSNNYVNFNNFFHLVKNQFEDAKNLISPSINYDNVKTYFDRFEDLIEINGEFFVYNSSEFTKINCEFFNGIIVDID